MPNHNTIDYSTFTAEELRDEIAGLHAELSVAEAGVASIEADIAKAEEALAKK